LGEGYEAVDLYDWTIGRLPTMSHFVGTRGRGYMIADESLIANELGQAEDLVLGRIRRVRRGRLAERCCDV
jgi:hypothetical protein